MSADTLGAPSQRPPAREGGGILIAGVVLAVLGVAAITFPYLATFAVEIIIAALITASGFVQLQQAFAMRRAPRAFWRGVTGLLWLAAGVIFLIAPAVGAVSLTLLVAALIGADGVLRLALGLRMRGRDGDWIWLVLAGVLSLALALLIAVGLPETAYWAIGLLLGVTLVIDGAALILARRSLAEASAHPAEPGAA